MTESLKTTNLKIVPPSPNGSAPDWEDAQRTGILQGLVDIFNDITEAGSVRVSAAKTFLTYCPAKGQESGQKTATATLRQVLD